MLLANILVIVLSLFIQGKVLPEKTAPVENELDTLALPVDHPEVVLARRAMSAQGLCFSKPPSEQPASDSGSVSAPFTSLGLAANCD